MRFLSLIPVLVLFYGTALVAEEKRVVSIHLCTDELLYLLEDHENIASLSYLSADPDYSRLAAEMSRFPLNHAQVEEIIPFQPDLVLAGSYSNLQTRHLLARLGYRVETVDIAMNLAQVDEAILRVGHLLGKEESSAQLIASLHERQQKAEARVAGKSRPLAVILGPNGYTHGKGSLAGELLVKAGYRNLAEESGIVGVGEISLETILSNQPDYLIIEDSASNKNSLAQRFLNHPALQKVQRHAKRITIDPNLWSCGGHSVVEALEILVEAHP